MAIRVPDRQAVTIKPRYILCGSRTETRQEEEVLRGIIVTRLEAIPRHITIVCGYNPKTGNPSGADKIIWQEARRMGFEVENHPADWERHGKSAGMVRNTKMAKLGAQRCIAFWDGESSGTKGMLDIAGLHHIPKEVVPWTRRKKRRPASTPSKSEDSQVV